MQRLVQRIHPRGLAGTALASLRIVGLMYTSLAGIFALALVVSVALLPATEPTRQMVSGFVQPTTDAVVEFMSTGPQVNWEPPVAVAASPMQGVDVGAAIALTATYTNLVDAAADSADRAQYQTNAVGEPVAVEEPTQQPAPRRVYRPTIIAPLPVAAAELATSEDVPAEVAPSPEPSAPVPEAIPVAVPDERASLVIANDAPPRELPPMPRATETPQQIKDRQDRDNQTAIDAAKAAQVRAKADADAANQRAISTRQASEAAATLTARTIGDAANAAAIKAAAAAPTSGATPVRTPTARPKR